MSSVALDTRGILSRILQKLREPEVVVAAAVALLSALAGWLLVENAYTVMRGDAVAYWDMAQVPIDPNQSWTWDGVPNSNVPYTYRIAIPFVVRNFFGSSMGGFIFMAIASLFISNYLVFKISRLYSRNLLVNSLIVIVFATNFTIFNPLINSALVDLPSFVFMLLLIYIFLKYINIERPTSRATWLLFAAILLVAVLIKEWLFFVLPVLFIYLLLIRQTRKAASLFAYSLPAVAVHLAIRLIMGPLFPELQSPSLALLFERYFTEIGAYRSLFATFGAIWLIIPLALFNSFRNNRAMKETYMPVIIAFFVWPVIGTIASDHNRYLFFISFPFLIPALSIYFAKYNEHIKQGALYAILALLTVTRLAMHYRPELQEGFAPAAGQSEEVIVVISVVAVIQIVVIIYYVVAAHRKFPLPGIISRTA